MTRRTSEVISTERLLRYVCEIVTWSIVYEPNHDHHYGDEHDDDDKLYIQKFDYIFNYIFDYSMMNSVFIFTLKIPMYTAFIQLYNASSKLHIEVSILKRGLKHHCQTSGGDWIYSHRINF